MCFLWGFGMYRRLKQPRTGAAVLVFLQQLLRNACCWRKWLIVLWKQSIKSTAVRFWGKGDTRQVAKWDTVFFYELYHRHFWIHVFPPQNPNLARPNHLIRGLLSRENVSSYSEIVWFGVKQGRQKAYFECSNKVYCRALVLNVHLKSTSLGSNLFLEVHPDLFMSCLGTANITCLWRWSLNSFQNCVRLFLLSRKLTRCVKGWTGL